VSTDAQQKEGTIQSQVLELKRQIAAAGDVLVKEYIDNGYSGTLLDRPGLEELRRHLKTSLFDAVYFLDTDRIARDVAYQTIILGDVPLCRLLKAELGPLRPKEARLSAPDGSKRSAKHRRNRFPDL
jgi:hypothetical protein